MRTSVLSLRISIGILTLLTPCSALSAVHINEIMYDLEGSDSDREWIEVINNGNGSVDIESFKLFENGSNHGFTLVSGASVLSAGGVAIIAANASVFLAEHAGFSGILFDSAFSLSNTGETLAIRTGADTEEDSVTYAATMGAQGDGTSLGRSGTTFMAQTASPGVSTAITPTQEDDAPTISTSNSGPSAFTPEPHITVRASGNRSLVVGASSVMSAHVYGLKGEPIDVARIVWNLGNGETKEGAAVEFLYRYPGRYAASVTGVVGAHSATERFVVEAREATVTFWSETDGSLVLLQNTGRDLDLSLWQVERGGSFFRLPQGTVILSGEGVRLSPQTTGLPSVGVARLLYPNGQEKAFSTPTLERILTYPSPASISQPIPLHFEEPPEVAPTAVEEPPKAVYTLAAAAEARPAGPWVWALGAVAVVLVGVAGVVLIRGVDPVEAQSDAADREAEKYTLV